jgi:hypothetical protein
LNFSSRSRRSCSSCCGDFCGPWSVKTRSCSRALLCFAAASSLLTCGGGTCGGPPLPAFPYRCCCCCCCYY